VRSREHLEERDFEELFRQLKTVKDRVEWLLASYPAARNDDLYLYVLYLRHFCPEASQYIRFIPYEVFRQFPRFETISRCRRKIQSEGRYLPTDPEVLKRRSRLAEAYRRVMPRL